MFLKFLLFQTFIFYPEGYSSELLPLDRFGLHQSLQFRRIQFGVIVLFNLVCGSTECPELLKLLEFRIPQFYSRLTFTFYTKPVRTNVAFSSHVYVYVVCTNFNAFSQDCGLFFDTLSAVGNQGCMRASVWQPHMIYMIFFLFSSCLAPVGLDVCPCDIVY